MLSSYIMHPALCLKPIVDDKRHQDREVKNSLMQAAVEESLCFEPQNGEDDGAGVDAGEGVAGREDVDIANHVGVVVVVAPE